MEGALRHTCLLLLSVLGGHVGKSPGHAGKTTSGRYLITLKSHNDKKDMVELQRTCLLERHSEPALCMADTVNSYTHDNVT